MGIDTLLALMKFFICIFKDGWRIDFRVAYIKLKLNSWSLNCDDIFFLIFKENNRGVHRIKDKCTQAGDIHHERCLIFKTLTFSTNLKEL